MGRPTVTEVQVAQADFIVVPVAPTDTLRHSEFQLLFWRRLPTGEARELNTHPVPTATNAKSVKDQRQFFSFATARRKVPD
jgi:hypothetical protein